MNLTIISLESLFLPECKSTITLHFTYSLQSHGTVDMKEARIMSHYRPSEWLKDFFSPKLLSRISVSTDRPKFFILSSLPFFAANISLKKGILLTVMWSASRSVAQYRKLLKVFNN